MYQGDQYFIECSVADEHGVKFTPDNCVDLKIQIGYKEKKYSDGSLLWDADKDCWLFFLAQEDTLFMKTTVNFQAQVRLPGDVIISTPVITKDISDSIIRKTWGD